MAKVKLKSSIKPSNRLWLIKAIPEGGSWQDKNTTERDYVFWNKKSAMKNLKIFRSTALQARARGQKTNTVFAVFELIAFSDIIAPRRDWNVEYELDDILFLKPIS